MAGGEGWIIAFTAGVAGLAILLILPPGIALAWLLARRRFPGKALVETAVALPLVMPPVATGLILLKLLGRRGALGGFLHERFDFDLIFTWRAVVIAMAVMSFPLLVRTARVAFEKVDPLLEKSARTLGAGRTRVFFSITLPLASGGVAGGTLLAFARALGSSAPPSWWPATSPAAPPPSPSPSTTSSNSARTTTPSASSPGRSESPSSPSGAARPSCGGRWMG